VGFGPTNGGFAVLRSGAKLFIFLGDFVGLDRLTMLLLPDSVSRFVSRILLYSYYRGYGNPGLLGQRYQAQFCLLMGPGTVSEI